VSFPSAHTAWAFALAYEVDRETRPRWVPLVAYPLAGLTAWSRVHDREHWTSDVVGGAVVGVWAAHKFDVIFPRRRGAGDGGASHAGVRLGVGEAPDGRGVGPAVTLRF
jgi:membrane-associated phospholipid phosphatase